MKSAHRAGADSDMFKKILIANRGEIACRIAHTCRRLRIDAVIDAARRTGSQAIHPGFGFLAENAVFARTVEAAGLVFVGPTPEVIERLGDKASAKREARAAGVAVLGGSEL